MYQSFDKVGYVSHIVEDTKEVERSLGSGIGAGVDSHEVVGAKGGVVDVAVGERAMVTPTQRVVPAEEHTT